MTIEEAWTEYIGKPRKPNSILERALLPFASKKRVRKYLGGLWRCYELEPGYTSWHWLSSVKRIDDRTIIRQEIYD